MYVSCDAIACYIILKFTKKKKQLNLLRWTNRTLAVHEWVDSRFLVLEVNPQLLRLLSTYILSIKACP